MNQEKIGTFLRQLRTESGKTQEQLAEQLGVNNRTVSRWENGRTMPDFVLLVELGRLYSVTVDELLEGERHTQNTKKEEEKAMKKIADYTEKEKQFLVGRLNRCFAIGTVFLLAAVVGQSVKDEGVLWCALSGFGQGGALGILLVGMLMTSRLGPRILTAKRELFKKVLKQ